MNQIIMATILAGLLAGCSGESESTAGLSDNQSNPNPDIWLFEVHGKEVNGRTRLTDWSGYDNQPLFTPDGQSVLFTSDREGRAHTYEYDLESGDITQLSFSDADKYSPTTIPGSEGTTYSVVHTDSEAFQGLWRYSRDGSIPPEPLVEVDAVAYYTWAGTGAVLFWRLGEPNTLQLIDVVSSDTTVLATGTVLSLSPMPGEAASAYIFSDSTSSKIMRFDWETQQSTSLAPGLEGSQYFTVSPRGDLLMILDGMLMAFSPGVSQEWELVADLGLQGGSRLSMSPDGNWLAVVAEGEVADAL